MSEGLEGLLKPKVKEPFTFEYEGESYVVHYRTVSWEEHFDAVERAWRTLSVTTEKAADSEEDEIVLRREFKAAQYYEEVLLLALLDINSHKVTPSVLREFDSVVISQLVTLVPKPQLITMRGDAKKESAS